MMKTKIRMLILSIAIILSKITVMAQGWTATSPYVYTTTFTDNVGIGTSTPNYPLDIANWVSGGAINTGGNFDISLRGLNAAVGTQSTARHAVFGTQAGNQDILFVNYDFIGTGNYLEHMRIVGTEGAWQGNVGIGTPSPDSSALLHVSSTKKGVLIPNVALDSVTDGLTVVLPAHSLLVYNTGAGLLSPAGYYYNAGTAIAPNWVRFGTATGWDVIGNNGTIPSTATIGSTVNNNFIGTTDNKDWVMATNNRERARIKANGNIGINITSPDEKLQIFEGNIRLSYNYNIHWGTATTGPKAFIGTYSSSPYRGIRYSSKSEATGWHGVHDFYTQAGVTDNDPSVLTMRIMDNGVAVFSANPNFYGIAGGSDKIMSVSSSTNSSNSTLILAGGSGAGGTINLGNQAVRQAIISSLNGSHLTFSTNGSNSGTSNTERMRIINTGNIGIGTTTPDITGNGSAFRTVSILGPNTSAGSCGILELATQSTDADANVAGVINFTASANAATKQSIAQITAWTQGASSTNRGGFLSFTTKPNGSTSTVERMRITNEGRVGIGTSAPSSSFILDVQGAGATGTINSSGDIWATGTYVGSDQMFKTDVDSLQNALAIIKQLKPKSYYFDTLNFNGTGKFNFSSAKQYGFLANEIQNVLPEIVGTTVKPAVIDSLGNVIKPAYAYRGLNYIELIPFLTKGIQELEFKNDNLQSKVNNQDSINTLLQNQLSQLTINNSALQNQINELIANGNLVQNQFNQLLESINSCCNTTTRSTQVETTDETQTQEMQHTNVNLKDLQSLVLQQNVPNPFKEKTTINYTLPESYVQAQLLFYNSQGQLIQSVDLTGNGTGQLNVFADDLTNGIYSYSLIIDGQIVATKKMIKSK